MAYSYIVTAKHEEEHIPLIHHHPLSFFAYQRDIDECYVVVERLEDREAMHHSPWRSGGLNNGE
ncbi:hypothetical protein J6590_002642 [Homalodisca vitripennis]|nr:hypothetical protein J6590_002642 [Homalodisca vitripennis]